MKQLLFYITRTFLLDLPHIYGVHCSIANTDITLQPGTSPVLQRLGILMSINRYIEKVKKTKSNIKPVLVCANRDVVLHLLFKLSPSFS